MLDRAKNPAKIKENQPEVGIHEKLQGIAGIIFVILITVFFIDLTSPAERSIPDYLQVIPYNETEDKNVVFNLEPTGQNFTNSLNMELVLIPEGTFYMGSPFTEKGREKDEGPLHRVTIQKPFYISKYEVTEEQWWTIMADSEYKVTQSPWVTIKHYPSLNYKGFKGENRAMCRVSWDDSQLFIKDLNEREETDKYRLPSDAEWEYCCRAGSQDMYCFGNNESLLANYAWFSTDDWNDWSGPQPVGQKKPNSWGLYDMHGNVQEWVQDTWHGSYEGVPNDGRAWEDSSEIYRIMRGGNGGLNAYSCRSASRSRAEPHEFDYENFGFRIVRDI
jgi:Uncharacterized conserved protein